MKVFFLLVFNCRCQVVAEGCSGGLLSGSKEILTLDSSMQIDPRPDGRLMKAGTLQRWMADVLTQNGCWSPYSQYL